MEGYEYEDAHPPIHHQFFSFYAPRKLRPRRPWKKLETMNIERELKESRIYFRANRLKDYRKNSILPEVTTDDQLKAGEKEIKRIRKACEELHYPAIVVDVMKQTEISMDEMDLKHIMNPEFDLHTLRTQILENNDMNKLKRQYISLRNQLRDINRVIQL